MSYSNLERVSCTELIARVSSVLPGTLRAKSVGTKAGKGAWSGSGSGLGRLRVRLRVRVRVRVKGEG